MRTEDLKHYIKLRRLVENPWRVVRFRKHQHLGTQMKVRFRDGRRLMLRGMSSDFYIFCEIFLRDEYRLDGHVAGLGCAVDVGANVGFFAFRMAPLAQRVICYEPAQDNMRQLEANLRCLDNVTCVRQAVASSPGVVRLYPPKNPKRSGQYSLDRQGKAIDSTRFEEIQATTLDDLFDRHRIERCDLLKLDVEGAEYEILYTTSAKTLGKTQALYGEYHNVWSSAWDTRVGTLMDFLRTHGFHVEIVPHRQSDNVGLFFATRCHTHAV